MRWTMSAFIAIAIAFYATLAVAHSFCNSFDWVDERLRGPRFSETERSIWVVGDVTFRHYRNDQTETWTIVYTWVVRPGAVAACVVLSGTGIPGRDA